MYSIGAYSNSLATTDPKWGRNGSVTVIAVIFAPISLAKTIACSTALAARSDPSVGTRMFLNNVGLLLSLLPRDGERAANQVAGRHRSECTASPLGYHRRLNCRRSGASSARPRPFSSKCQAHTTQTLPQRQQAPLGQRGTTVGHPMVSDRMPGAGARPEICPHHRSHEIDSTIPQAKSGRAPEDVWPRARVPECSP